MVAGVVQAPRIDLTNEELIRSHINATVLSFLNADEFKDFAFNTHIQAYWDAGFYTLTTRDIEHIREILELKEYLDKDTWETMSALGIAYSENYINHNFENVKIKAVFYHLCLKSSGKSHEICLAN
jgi:hypothetical protein